MYEAYRVFKRFQWRGWEYAPEGRCQCSTQANPDGNACVENGCKKKAGSGCTACPPEACRCACNIPVATYAGDIWPVEAGHPRKEHMLANRFATYDDSLPPIDELMKDEKISRLVKLPEASVPKRKQVKHKAMPPGDVREPSVA